eukprot:7085876-Prymnesium_polylepis.1
MKLGCQLLRLVRPRQGVEVDEHVVAHAQIARELEEAWPTFVQLVRELSRPQVVRAAVHLDGRVLPGKLEARRALQIDVAHRLGQQPLADEDHRAILERCDARPLEWRLLEEGVKHVGGRRHLHLGRFPLIRPIGKHRLLDPPLLHPL